MYVLFIKWLTHTRPLAILYKLHAPIHIYEALLIPKVRLGVLGDIAHKSHLLLNSLGERMGLLTSNSLKRLN
jgi:hypothetical protein